MTPRQLVFDSIKYTTETGPFGAVRKARILFRVITKDTHDTYTLPVSCLVDDEISEENMIDYARAEFEEVFNQISGIKP